MQQKEEIIKNSKLNTIQSEGWTPIAYLKSYNKKVSIWTIVNFKSYNIIKILGSVSSKLGVALHASPVQKQATWKKDLKLQSGLLAYESSHMHTYMAHESCWVTSWVEKSKKILICACK